MVYKTHTLECCLKSALKYKTRGKWQKYNEDHYRAAMRNNYFERCVEHMEGYITHTLECCQKSALKYKTRNEWQKYDKNHYSAAHRNNYFEICVKHMGDSLKSRKNYNNEQIIKIAQKYETRYEWFKAHELHYRYAKRHDFFMECTAHMKKPSGGGRPKNDTSK